MKKMDCLDQLAGMGLLFSQYDALIRIAIVLELPLSIVSYLVERGCPVKGDHIEMAIRFHQNILLDYLLEHSLVNGSKESQIAVECTSARCLSSIVMFGARCTESMVL
jgi:hypothetical protein